MVLEVAENSPVKESQLEKVLLDYLEVPYFQNNPWYVALWKRLYAQEQDSAVLFLMRMKGVGCFSSWVYLRLFEHFTAKGCAVCAQSIISEGVKAKAHPLAELEAKLADVRVDALTHKLEVPARLFVLRREWQKQTAIGYRRELLRIEERDVSFTEYKVFRYLSQKRKRIEEETEKGLNEVSLLFGSLNDSPRKRAKPAAAAAPLSHWPAAGPLPEAELNHEADYLGIDDDLELPFAYPIASTPPTEPRASQDEEGGAAVGPACAVVQSDESAMPMAIGMAELGVDDSSQVPKERRFGTPAVGDKLVVEGVLYIAKRLVGNRTLVVTRIASLGDGNVTLNAKDFALKYREVNGQGRKECDLARALKAHPLCVPVDIFVAYADKLVTLSPYQEMGSLARAIALMVEKQGDFPEILAAHYLKEVLIIGHSLETQGYSMANCLADDLVLLVDSGKIRLKLAAYKRLTSGPFTSDAAIVQSITRRAKIEHSQTLLTHPQSPSAWINTLEAYLNQKKESSELQNLFIAQEVSIYEEE